MTPWLTMDSGSMRFCPAYLGPSWLRNIPIIRKVPRRSVLQLDTEGRPLHAVWGIPRGYNSPAVLVTAYKPDPALWDPTFTRRVRP
jgi:hypothetical protein